MCGFIVTPYMRIVEVFHGVDLFRALSLIRRAHRIQHTFDFRLNLQFD